MTFTHLRLRIFWALLVWAGSSMIVLVSLSGSPQLIGRWLSQDERGLLEAKAVEQAIKNGRPGYRFSKNESQVTTTAISGISNERISLSMWVNFDKMEGHQQLAYLEGQGRFLFLSTYTPNGKHNGIHFGTVYQDGTWGRAYTSNQSFFEKGRWYHIVSILDVSGGRIRIYRDAKMIIDQVINIGIIPLIPKRLWIGSSPGGQSHTAQGTIADVNLYNGVLSKRDVQLLYKGRHLYAYRPYLLGIIFSLFLAAACFYFFDRISFFNDRSAILRICLIVIGGITLCYVSFYNKYPLLFGDTAAYIQSAFYLKVPFDRPLIYGLFIRLASLTGSFWPTILLQGILLSTSLFLCFKHFLPERNFTLSFFTYIILITFFTGASINVSVLIPDIFTSIMILSAGTILFAYEISIKDKLLCSALVVFSAAMHNANSLILASIIILMTASRSLRFARNISSWPNFRRIFWLFGLLLCAPLFMSIVHSHFGSSAKPVKNGSRFMLHHFNQIGLLKKYLDESCYYKKYPLCEFKDKLTPQFLWHPESPFNLTGGWQKNAEEHNQIVRDLVTNHRYLSIYLKRAIESSFKQFFLFQSDPSYESRHPVDLTLKMIKNTYPYQKHQILDSLQNNGLLDLNRFDARQEMIICIAIIVFVFTIANQCFERNNFFFIYILFALFINAVICAFFSDPAQRYQNRVVFILSLPAFLAFIKSDLYGYFSKLLKVDD